MDLLRFITAGNVDDGKSTLIGRLLFDSKSVSLDILETLQRQSKNVEEGEIDLALLTDGLRAEREQGITIDVAYKYFTTAKRKFIIADAPGHVQYTRNLVTGASNSDLAIILVDARNGLQEQTFRHSYISSLLGIPNLVVCINKMDLVDYSEGRYNDIVMAYEFFAKNLNLKNIQYIPISAKSGDNVVDASVNTPWYKGPSLLEYLENVEVNVDNDFEHGRFPVQYVIRPQVDELHDYRGYAGRVASGTFKKGETVIVLPSGYTSIIESIDTYGGSVEEAFAQQSVTIRLKDDIDISRGDILVPKNNQPRLEQELEGELCWMDAKQLEVGGKYLLQHNSARVKCVVREVLHKVNVNTLGKIEDGSPVQLNDIARVVVKMASPIGFDSYLSNRAYGAAIIIDERTNNTVGALMLV